MTTLKAYFPLLAFGLALTAVYLATLFVVHALPQAPHPDVVAAALTLDLMVIVPLLYYGLLVRRKRWPAVTVAPVFLLSLGAASLVVPAGHHGMLDILTLLSALVEVLLLGYVGLKVARTVRRFRTQEAGVDLDVFERLRTSLRETLGNRFAADVLASEVGLFYYALFSWRAAAPAGLKHRAFSYHQQSGYDAIVGGILVAMLMEMIALHLLLQFWSPALAWGLTALSGYGVLWLVGDARAVRLRPIRVEKDALLIRIGLRWTVRVPFLAIGTMRPAGRQAPPKKTPGYLEAVLWSRPRYLIDLNEPILAQGLYGFRKPVTILGFTVNDPAAFEAVLKQQYAAWQQGAA
jgi:hypothetical protein